MMGRFPVMFGFNFHSQNDSIKTGQRWPIIPGARAIVGGAAVVRAIFELKPEYSEFGNKYCKREDFQLKSILNERAFCNTRKEDKIHVQRRIHKENHRVNEPLQ